MCGIVGVISKAPVNQLIYDALLLLQHRGQDAAGIVTAGPDAHGRKFFMHKARGMVKDVFRTRNMRALPGTVGLGQVRYPTAGNAFNEEEAQPFYVNAPFGLVLVHNGNLTNAHALREDLFAIDRRHLNTDSDTEVLLNVFAHELDLQRVLTPEAVFRALEGVNRRAKGGYAVVCAVLGLGLVAFRDPHGIRPLVLGKRATAQGDEYIVASESVALDILGFDRVRDVEPGECLVITARGELFAKQCAQPQEHAPCIFEYVYFARPDSMIDNVSVHKARMRMGVKLGEKILRLRPDHDIDTIIPIPDTSRDAALEISNVLGVKYREGFIKNRYVGRTFIMPGQGERVKSVRRKLNPINLEFRNRVVLLVDDSIVRGTTSKQIVQMARDAGARKVYLASAAPPVRHPNIYGIDMPAADELVAHGRSVEEIEKLLGCDWLIYQDLEDLEAAVREGNPNLPRFDSSCFDGQYVTGIEPGYFERIEQMRSDEAKRKRRVG